MKFKVQPLFRISLIIGATVAIFLLFESLYELIVDKQGINNFREVFAMILYLGLIFSAISLNTMQFIISDEALIVQYLIKKKKEYRFSEIEKIEEVIQVIPCVKVYFKGKKLPTKFIVERYKEFSDILRKRISVGS